MIKRVTVDTDYILYKLNEHNDCLFFQRWYHIHLCGHHFECWRHAVRLVDENIPDGIDCIMCNPSVFEVEWFAMPNEIVCDWIGNIVKMCWENR